MVFYEVEYLFAIDIAVKSIQFSYMGQSSIEILNISS